MSLYKVTGPYEYHDNPPGSLFEASLPADGEARAIRFGFITLIERREIALQPGSWKLPRGWPSTTLKRSI